MAGARLVEVADEGGEFVIMPTTSDHSPDSFEPRPEGFQRLRTEDAGELGRFILRALHSSA